MKKKVIRISTVPGTINGLLQGQLKMLSSNYNVIAISSPGKELKEIAIRENVRTIPIAMERRISFIKDIISLFRLIFVFHKEKPWMVHSITPKAGLLSMIAAWICRVPVRIHTFTGLIFPTAQGILKKTLILTDKLTCFCATHINPEGKGVMNDLKKYQITAKPMFLIANGNINGVDINYYSRTQEIEKQSLNLKYDGYITFCFIGRIVKDKGIHELLTAFCNIHSQNKLVKLYILGRFEEQDAINEADKEIILKHKDIHYVGYQKNIRPYLCASDILVLPSYREGFPNVVLQAGAMGVPTIVTDINGCNEIIQHSINGLIVPPKDSNALSNAMLSFIENPAQIHLMRPACIQRVNQLYRTELIWEALLNKYKELEYISK